MHHHLIVSCSDRELRVVRPVVCGRAASAHCNWAMQPISAEESGTISKFTCDIPGRAHHDWQASEYASRVCQAVGEQSSAAWSSQLMSPWVTLDARHAHLHARCAGEQPHRRASARDCVAPMSCPFMLPQQCLARASDDVAGALDGGDVALPSVA